MKTLLSHVIALAALTLGSAQLSAAEPAVTGTTGAQSPPQKLLDLTYKTVANHPLKLDLYLPDKTSTPSPLVIWIHGGGWRAGSKDGAPVLPLVSSGFAVASIDYRLSGESPFPAQIEDVKAAIRWLRAHAGEYGLAPDRFGVIGHSAGGHLASLVGVTGHGSTFDVGDNLDNSSAVQAVCVMSGPEDIVTMFDGADDYRRNALVGLLGGSLPEKQKLAVAASPITYVQSGTPPFLFIQGADDQVVPLQQAQAMIHKLEEAGAKPAVIILPQTGHDVFARNQQFASQIKDFFTKALEKKNQ